MSSFSQLWSSTPIFYRAHFLKSSFLKPRLLALFDFWGHFLRIDGTSAPTKLHLLYSELICCLIAWQLRVFAFLFETAILSFISPDKSNSSTTQTHENSAHTISMWYRLIFLVLATHWYLLYIRISHIKFLQTGSQKDQAQSPIFT